MCRSRWITAGRRRFIKTMQAQISRFYTDCRLALPFFIVFLTSLFLPTASNRIVFYLAAPILLYQLYLHRADLKPYLQTWSFRFLVFYLGYFFFTIFWSEQFSLARLGKHLRDVSSIAVFVTAFAVLIPKVSLPRKLPLYFAGICALWGIAAAANFYGLLGNEGGSRLTGFGRYENSIHMALLFSIALIALLSLWISHKVGCPRQKGLMSGIIVVLLFLIALTQTRSAYLALLVCMGFLFLIGHMRYALPVLAAAVIGVTCMYFASDSYMEMFSGRLDSNRFQIWEEALDGIAEQPVIGHGLATEPKFFNDSPDLKRGWKSTHNVLLGHAYVGGVIGLLAFLGLAANMVRVAVRRYRYERSCRECLTYATIFTCLTICFGLTASLTNFSHYVVGVHIQWLVFWVPFSLAWIIEARGRNLKEQDAPAY